MDQSDIFMKLEIQKTKLQILVESDKALVEFSKMILRGSFILNGAAAIAIIPTANAALYFAMVIFALGAMLSAMSSGATYLAQFFSVISWSRVLYENPFAFTHDEDERKICKAKSKRKWYIVFQTIATILAMLSLACFGLGLYESFNAMVK